MPRFALTLPRDTQATLIHGITRQQVADETLPAGTRYELAESHHDGLGHRVERIKVLANAQVWLYDVYPEQLR